MEAAQGWANNQRENLTKLYFDFELKPKIQVYDMSSYVAVAGTPQVLS